MNKNKSQFVIPIIILSAIVAVAAAFFAIKPKYDEYKQAKLDAQYSKNESERLSREAAEIEAGQRREEEQLKTIKAIFKTDKDSTSDNLSMFGTMFDDIIQSIQHNGLMIRSIGYQMQPDTDPLSINFSKEYNVCELKFFLVGTYPQIKSLLNDLTGPFPYLIGLSKVNVLLYEENTDYVLVDLAVNLYSEKK